MKDSATRVRFAPSPTGMMHLGNIRTALMNYIFAHHNNGTFVLRVEDTDPARNFDPGAKKIIEDLQWLGLNYDEGPIVGGPYAPYFQSERNDIHKQYLNKLIENKLVYRCFCTSEELDKKRQRQIALKRPPRYDRTCLEKNEQDITVLLEKNTPFIWRFKLDQDKTISITDLARGSITFDLKHFSDFPLTRQDGSFTFMFANFVDDLSMNITHVLRGEDHLSNTAGQAALYDALQHPCPTFLHLPILANIEGKKLSKRDFGFSLSDLQDAGYLPEAICNYLAIIGGGSFKEEIMPLDELCKSIDFKNIHATGQVKYDVEKLTWVNHKWIDRYDPVKLAQLCRPYLEKAYPEAANINESTLVKLVQFTKAGYKTLTDCVQELAFYFSPVEINEEMRASFEHRSQLCTIIHDHLDLLNDEVTFAKTVQTNAKEQGLPIKALWQFVRFGLMGSKQGPSVQDLITMLGADESRKRLQQMCSHK